MGENGLPEEEGLETGGTLKGWHFALIVLVAVALLAAYYWLGMRGDKPRVESGGVTEVPAGSRTVTLFFADDEQPALFAETRQLAIGKGFVDQVTQVVEALVAGPSRDGVSTIPDGTSLLGVFYDDTTFTLFLDFSSELVAAHPGGSSAEYYTISSIMKTVSENFPEVQSVQILVEGLQVGTIAGHIDTSDPLNVRDWR